MKTNTPFLNAFRKEFAFPKGAHFIAGRKETQEEKEYRLYRASKTKGWNRTPKQVKARAASKVAKQSRKTNYNKL